MAVDAGHPEVFDALAPDSDAASEKGKGVKVTHLACHTLSV